MLIKISCLKRNLTVMTSDRLQFEHLHEMKKRQKIVGMSLWGRKFIQTVFIRQTQFNLCSLFLMCRFTVHKTPHRSYRSLHKQTDTESYWYFYNFMVILDFLLCEKPHTWLNLLLLCIKPPETQRKLNYIDIKRIKTRFTPFPSRQFEKWFGAGA